MVTPRRRDSVGSTRFRGRSSTTTTHHYGVTLSDHFQDGCTHRGAPWLRLMAEMHFINTPAPAPISEPWCTAATGTSVAVHPVQKQDTDFAAVAAKTGDREDIVNHHHGRALRRGEVNEKSCAAFTEFNVLEPRGTGAGHGLRFTLNLPRCPPANGAWALNGPMPTATGQQDAPVPGAEH